MKLSPAWIPALLLVLAGCPPRNPSPLDLRDKLWTDANKVFEQRKVLLTEEARGPLRNFIEQGAVKLETAHASEAEIRAAEEAVRSLAMDMALHAERGGPGTRGVVEVLEKDFQAIRKKICPLYPFCK